MCIQMIEEMDYCLNIYLVIAISQRHKSQNQGMLHLDFIQENVFASSFDVAVEKQGSRDGTEEEHVEEYEQ